MAAVVGFTGASVCAGITLSQTDLKAMIAYSRVVHIGILMACTLSGRRGSILPALIIMVAHGVCSSGLFFCGTSSYERVTTRNLMVSQGLITVMPGLTLP